MSRVVRFIILVAPLLAFAGCPPPPGDGGGDDDCTPSCNGKACGDNDGCGGICECSGGTKVSGNIQFEALIPSTGVNGVVLDKLIALPAFGMVVGVRDGSGNVIGLSEVDDEGDFSVTLDRELPAAGAELVFVAAWFPDVNAGALLAVLDPGSGGSPTSRTSPIWAWTKDVPASGKVGDLIIREASGSGAAYVYLFTLGAMGTILNDTLGGQAGGMNSLAVLWSPGVAWSCGCCYAGGMSQTTSSGSVLEQSIFLGGESGGPSAWGYAVMLHEFGHYVARNYSRDDSPGGPHTLGVPVVPAFAWSEGFASFFAVSTFSRWIGEAMPRYWDIQNGTSFWIDYSAGQYTNGAIGKPNMGGGMAQSLDENFVGYALWHLWDGDDLPEENPGDGTALGTERTIRALSAPRMLQANRGAAGADLVDFVDAVLCDDPGLKNKVTSTLVDYVGFPYDGAPGCSWRMRAPMHLDLAGERRGAETVLQARLTVEGALPSEAIMAIDVPAGATLISGLAEEALGWLEPGTVIERSFRVRAAGAPLRVSVAARSAGAAVHAEKRYPEEPAVKQVRPTLDAIAPLHFRGLTIDRAVRLSNEDIRR